MAEILSSGAPGAARTMTSVLSLLLQGERGLEEFFHERQIGIARPEFLFRIIRKPREHLVGGEFFIRRVAFKENLGRTTERAKCLLAIRNRYQLSG